MSQQFLATLVRGTSHYYAGKSFARDVPQAVSAEQKAYLEENAIETVGSGENEHSFPRFKFETVAAEDGEAEKAAPARTRKPAGN